MPYGTKADYSAAEGWRDFGKIVESDTASLSAITQDEQETAEIYTIDGKRANGNKPGAITIRRLTNGATRKEIIR